MWFEAKVPSNIAFLKYWGKRDAALQWPANDSLSMTLDGLATVTKVKVLSDHNLKSKGEHKFFFAGEEKYRDDPEGAKVFKFLDGLAQRFDFRGCLEIHTKNQFPTGCGIASSASGFGALTIAAIAAWTKSESLAELEQNGFSLSSLAQLARMGSGSACRSFWGGYVRWEAGENADLQRCQQALPSEHWALTDTVVLFSEAKKARSSSQAHLDAWSSPLFKVRLVELRSRLEAMHQALESRDMDRLGPLLETEALEMHAVMMSARPATYFFDHETADFLVWFREQRAKGLFKAYFTIDAGPNVHVIAEPGEQQAFLRCFSKDFSKYRYLSDCVGSGPQLGFSN